MIKFPPHKDLQLCNEDRRVIMSMRNEPEELYNPRVAYNLGFIESIIDRAFEDTRNIHQVVDDIEKRLEEIKRLIEK